MRSSNRGVAIAGAVRAAGLILGLAVAAGCTGAASPSPPSATATPVPTPDPQLSEPASADEIFIALQRGGVSVRPNSAEAGANEPVKRISATYAGWPLVVSEFSSATSLREAGSFDAAAPLRAGDPVYAVAGLNILVEFGPKGGASVPDAPDASQRDAMMALVAILDPLLGPLEQRAVEPLALPRVARTPTPAPSPSDGPAP